MLQEASGAAGHPSYRRFHYGTGPLLVEDGATRRFISTDALGSTTDLTTTGATVASMRKYDAWGQYRNDTAPLANEPKLGFTGHQYDPETGLVYARARYYDPEMGRFISRDSYEGSLSEAPSLHRYTYSHGNPTRYTDPTGHEISTCTTHTGAPQCATAAGEAAGGTGTAAGTGAAGEGAGVTSRALVEAAKQAERIKAAEAAARAAAEAANKPAWWKAAAASLIAAVLGDKTKDMTPDEVRRAADDEARRITATTQQLVGKDVKVVVEGPTGGTPVPISDPGDHRPITAPGDDGSAARVITDPTTGAPMAAPGTEGAPVSAPGADRGHPEYVAGDGTIGGFHGTTASRILGIMDKGGLVPSRGKVFIGDSPEATFVHGGDRSRGVNYSIRVEVALPRGASVERTRTPNVPLTTVIHSEELVPAQVTELHIRKPDGEGGYTHEVIRGPQAIRAYLTR